MQLSHRFPQKIFSISLSLWVFILSPLMTLSMLQPVRAEDKMNICDPTSSTSHPWNAIQINTSAWPAHLANGAFVYTGPINDPGNGQPTSAGEQWCLDHAPITPNSPPVLSLHSDITESTTSLAGKVINYSDPSATDSDGDIVSISCLPASGSTFPIGTTTVNCTATDGKGGSDTSSFTVTITLVAPSNNPPAIIPIPDIYRDTNNPTGTVVNYSEPTASDPDAGESVVVVCDYPSGSFFATGSTTVTCTATDTHGASDTTTFSVIVAYVEAPINHQPSLNTHADVSVTTTSSSGTVVVYTDPAATDPDGDTVTVSCTPTSGTLFSLGDTLVTCVATDEHGLTSTVLFTVHVTQVPVPPTFTANLHFTNPALSCGSFTTVGSNTVDWNDATAASGIAGYDYFVDYPLVGGGRGTWQTFVTASQYTGTLNEGIHHIRVRALDNDGNYSDWSPVCDITLDTTAPAIPTGLHRDNAARTTTYACGAVTTRQTLIPDWNDIVGDPSFDHFEYTSFNVGGSIGLNEIPLTASEYVHSWVPPVDGTYGYAVRSVDVAGNKSDWALSSKTLSGSCQITYDSVAPDVEITSPTNSLLRGSVAIRGTVTDDNPHHYWLVIQKVGGSVVAGPGTVNDSSSFTDKFFFNWNTTSVPDGDYIIKLEARDAAGNKDAGSVDWQTVTVDNTPPYLTVPSNITTEATGPTGAQVDFEATATDLHGGSIPVTCLPASHSMFAVGDTTVTCTATDDLGNTGSASFTVTVVDTTPPVVTVPSNIIVEAASSTGSTVTYGAATATDLVSGSVVTTCTPVSGSLFPLGVTTVTCSATDDSGNTGYNSFTVTVRDTTKPVFGPTNSIVKEADNPLGRIVTFTVTATDTVDGPITPLCTPSSGSMFPLGKTRVNCSATDAAGNTSTKRFDVWVVDTTKPTFGPISNIVTEATGPSGSVVHYTVTATDIVDTNVFIACLPASGSTFPLGTRTVVCAAVDNFFNFRITSFTVTVQDTTPPSLTIPSNQSFEATSAAGYTYSFSPTALDSVDGSTPVSCTPDSTGFTYPLGDTVVTCSSTDSHGNTGSASFTVTVVDTTPPVLTLPTNSEHFVPNSSGTVVSFEATALDSVDGNVPVTCIPASGSVFSLGTTLVTCSATDSNENTSSGTFSITVTDNEPPVITVPENQFFDEANTDSTYTYSFVPTVTDASEQFSSDTTTAIVVTPTPFSITCTHDQNGYDYPVGTTLVTCTAFDESGNMGTSSFDVTVANVVPTVAIAAVQNGNRSYTFTANPGNGNAPYTFAWSGDCSGSGQSKTTSTAPGTYDCTVTVTDQDGDTATSSISRTITPVAAAVLGAVEAANEETETQEGTPTELLAPGVLGERTCTETKKLVAYHYLDKNKNNVMDSGEQVFGNITGRVTYFVDDKEYVSGNFLSDATGRWELTVCPGEYVITVSENSLPAGLSETEKSQKVTVLADQDETVVYLALLSTVAWWWSWWWLLLLVFILVVFYYVYRKRKAHYEQNAQ